MSLGLEKNIKYQGKEKYMYEALKEAKKAYDIGEVPVGAVVVYNGEIIARGHNLRESKQKFSQHAEFIALEKASEKLKSWRLEDCEVYVTLEPCPMCAGAMIQSRVKKCYFGAYDLKSGVVSSIIKLFELPFNHYVEYEPMLLNNESEIMLKSFFKKLRE